MREMGLAVLLLAAPAAARADALRHAALAALLVRENPSDPGRRAALDVAFDAMALRPAGAEAVAAGFGGRRRNWFPKRAALAAERAVLRMPALPSATPVDSVSARTETALRAALAPWRALADAAWGGAWAGMVRVGLAEDAQR
ncbi:MAG: hypothetical protein HYZ75_05675 [Elusimicrobia bacterium]|nr:hypothetical protein [Elusimicrobiota bacterium]